jgi:hypothetical protein
MEGMSLFYLRVGDGIFEETPGENARAFGAAFRDVFGLEDEDERGC